MVRFLRAKTANTRHRIGRRGAVLFVAGIIYVLIGTMYALPFYEPRDTLAFPIALAPIAVWGGVYVVVGTVAIITAFWPTGRDAWGYAALVGFTSLWAVFGVMSALVFDSSRAWIVALVWMAYASLLLIVSGMRGIDDE